jgi:hypothetical protein
MTNAETKIKMLKGSMRCFAFGLLGLLPVVGLPFAIAALWISVPVQAKEKQFWNAAKPYRIVGTTCAEVVVIFWAGILAIIVIGALMNAF